VIEHSEKEVKLKDATNPMSATSLRGLVEQIMKIWNLIPIGQVEEADMELSPEDFSTPTTPNTPTAIIHSTTTTPTQQQQQQSAGQQLIPMPSHSSKIQQHGTVYQSVLSQDRLTFFLQELRLDTSVSQILARNHISFDILVNLSADDLIQIGIDSHSANSIFNRLKAIQSR